MVADKEHFWYTIGNLFRDIVLFQCLYPFDILPDVLYSLQHGLVSIFGPRHTLTEAQVNVAGHCAHGLWPD